MRLAALAERSSYMSVPDEGDGLRLVDALEDLTDLELLYQVRRGGPDAKRAQRVLMHRHRELVGRVYGWCIAWIPREDIEKKLRREGLVEREKEYKAAIVRKYGCKDDDKRVAAEVDKYVDVIVDKSVDDQLEDHVWKALRLGEDDPKDSFVNWFEPRFRERVVQWVVALWVPYVGRVVSRNEWSPGVDDREDIEADALKRLRIYLEKMPSSHGRPHAKVRSLVHRTGTDHARHRDRRPADELNALTEREVERLLQAREASAVSETDALVEALASSAVLRKLALGKLTERGRKVLLMRSQGLSYEEIALQLEISVGNARQIAFRATGKLRRAPEILEHITGAVDENAPRKKGKSDGNQGE